MLEMLKEPNPEHDAITRLAKNTTKIRPTAILLTFVVQFNLKGSRAKLDQLL